MPSYYDEYSRDLYETDLNVFPVRFLEPSPDQSAGVPAIFPNDTLEVDNIDLGPGAGPPPTNSDPTFYVTVEEPAAPAPAESGLPWWIWLIGGYAVYKALR